VSRDVGEGIGRHLADALARQHADLIEALRGLVTRDVDAFAEIGRIVAAAHNAQMERVSIPVTAHIRQEAQAAPVVDTAPIVDGISETARMLGDGLRALIERPQPSTVVQSPVTVDTAPLARAWADRADAAADGQAQVAAALQAHADAVSAGAKATAALAMAVGRPRVLTVSIERDTATGAVKRYTVEER
jgi:hypothetical protein